jgi:AraC-like DNA-binding protein
MEPIRHSLFDDAQLHAHGLADWEQQYDQVTPGNFKGAFSELRLEQITVVRECFNQRLVQAGQTPPGMLSVAIPVHLEGACTVQGLALGCNSVLLLDGATEFLFHTPPGTDYFVITMPKALFSHEEILWCRNRLEVFKLTDASIKQLRSLCSLAMSEPDDALATLNLEIFSDDLASSVLSIISQNMPPEPLNLTYATYSDIVSRSQKLTLESEDSPVTIAEICRRLKVSRRTLHNSFITVAGTSPLQYLKSIRLNAARREIRSSAFTLSVSDAAYHWGFLHLSHFSTDYQRLFGELPSSTLRRNGMSLLK